MTQEQENFFDKVIKPKLIKMALEDTLPMDMTQISSGYFYDEAEEYNKRDTTEGGVTEKMIENACTRYLSMDYEDASRVLREIYNDESIKDGTVIDHSHEDLQMAQNFEFTFTVTGFFDQIKL